VTLDCRHFGAVRSPQGRRFHLLTELSAGHEERVSYKGGAGVKPGEAGFVDTRDDGLLPCRSGG
jgi:hypothetical protein